jgi:NAD-dependent dihydropyrimidine dehydrogenase PreA subunit
MPGKKLTVVISQAPGRNPVKRHLEEELATSLLLDRDVEVSLVPHLYDMAADHTGLLFLRSIPSDVILLSWMYPRAARWILDRQGIKGREGQSLIQPEDDEEQDDDELPDAGQPQADSAAIGSVDVPDRAIYCLDLRDRSAAQDYLDEIRRIARESTVQTFDLMSFIKGSPQSGQLERYLNPKQMLESRPSDSASPGGSNGDGPAASAVLPEPTRQRWYPVIDYSRCTNCMECIDFCLFGVYGVDQRERILVEEQDNCKRGCPACSRVCPENAIIFPGHKTPAIAGANGEVAGLKIDLSKLFGAPSALELAAQERDVELVADGREAVGMTVGIPKRQSGAETAPRDELDDLIDGLDQLEL